MVTETAGDPRAGLGARLRGARERKGLTILQASEKLHVDPKVVQCLEAEHFAELGAPVYVRGYLRHYAELVGESAAELQALYAGQAHAAPPDLTRIPKAPHTAEPRQLLFPATLLVAGFALAGAVWWVLTVSSRGPVRPMRPSAAREQSSVPPVQASLPPASAAAAPPAAAAMQATPEAPPPGGTRAAAPAAPAHALPAVQPVQGAPAAARSLPAAGASVQEVSAASVAAAPRSRTAQLTLRYSADSWTEVYDARGERLYYDVGTAGSVRSVTGRPPLAVVLGNASGVTLEVDGRAATLTGHTRPDGSAQVQVSRSGRIMPAAAPQPVRRAQDGE